ncbi:MAG: molybdopterin molybdotransferase MoeA [Desulfobacteraceae bacterium]|jgi:molybdopterin molybdotransferase
MVRTLPLGLKEALGLTLQRVEPLPPIRVELLEGLNRALAEDICATVDSPSTDASMKDGYAVISSEVKDAKREDPVRLTLTDSLAAGESRKVRVLPGTAVRILTGARIPSGADAVVAEEFTEVESNTLTVYNNAEPGRNILPKSSDVAAGQIVAGKGSMVTPGLAGMLAAAGHSRIDVVRPPSVSIIATGDEVVAPGRPLPEGKLYASNMTTLGGWCRRYGMQIHMEVVEDDFTAIHRMLGQQSETADAIVTSGGAWTGDRDLVAKVLDRLGWQQIFHRIRIGPGKAVGFGMLNHKPVFILPGGPPSNLMGFLQIALPGLLKLAGHRRTGLPQANVRLASELTGRYADWTQFIFGILEIDSDIQVFRANKQTSRLRSMAQAQAVVAIPEGETVLPAGKVVAAQLLDEQGL